MIPPSNVSDPWDVRLENTRITIEWYGYRDPLPVPKAKRCLDKARSEAIQRVTEGYKDTRMGPLPYSYSEGNVELWLGIEPGETFVWLSWFSVLFRFPQYVEAIHWRGTQFIVLLDEHGQTNVVAFGHLVAH